MEEREGLRRQIRLLQGLIDDHKNIHGNVPVPPPDPAPRWRNPRPAFSNQSVFAARYSQQMPRDFPPGQSHTSSWRNKYSLVNLPSRPMLSSGSNISTSAVATRTTHSSTNSGAAELRPVVAGSNVGLVMEDKIVVVQAGSATGNTAVSRLQRGPAMPLEGLATSKGCGSSTVWPLKVGSKEDKGPEASSKPLLLRSKTVERSKGDGGPVVCRKRPVTAKAVQDASEPVPRLCKTISESAVTLKSELQQPLILPDHKSCYLSARKKLKPEVPAFHCSQQPPAVKGEPDPPRVADRFVVRSNAAWEESPAVEARLAESNPPQSPLPKAPASSTSVKSPNFRKASYTWVANPSKSPRTAKRWPTPRSSENAQHLTVGLEATAKFQSRGDVGAKQKKSSLHSKPRVSSSQYKWKASSPQQSPSTSVFTWRRKDSNKAGGGFSQAGTSTSLQGVRGLPLGHGTPRPFFGNAGFLNYKLRSRTKIIRRKGSAWSSADKRNISFPNVLLKSRYSLRKRSSPRGKSSPAGRRAGAKGLVQIGRHRLRRLPASRLQTSTKAGSNFLLFAGSNKVVNTRYRIVKKAAVFPSGPATSFSSPAQNWRTRRLSTSRSLVQNFSCQSPSGSKSPALAHHWRNKGLRCIGGVMYRVSANKLAKTCSPSARSGDVMCRSHTKSAWLDAARGFPGYSPLNSPSRLATSRYIASRAVQRSLAIIRQAKQKKEKKKEYCMYYNRFGKCNRGESCPYIHDPEKIAVCTRFLRGTCKKTDGTCPFSHKVSKDKMPVCSYFLKGICNNSDCPYSHVYVSRKAEVCADFLKGYCPLGKKCKKKHTLVCPDFSKHGTCPKGSQCKLQHPQRKRPARPPRTRDALPSWDHPADVEAWRKEAEEETVAPSQAEEGGDVQVSRGPPQASKLAKLPSFISLQTPPTSPSEEDHKPEKERQGEDAGKPLQIKPRL